MLLVVSNRTALSNGLLRQLRLILPAGWSAHAAAGGAPQSDGWLEVTTPDGRPNRFEVEVKNRFEPRDIDRIERLSRDLPEREHTLLVAPHLSARSRQLLKERNISYVDLSGNAWLTTDSILIDRTGAEKAPKAGEKARSRTSLRGPITGRIVRYLCDVRPPHKVREIASNTHVHPGNVSRILDFLTRERLVERGRNGSVTGADWESLIQHWADDLKKDRQAQMFLEPRGIDAVTSALSRWTPPYALTGAYASAQLAPVSAPIAIDVYVTEIDEAREALSLRASDRIGNVRLLRAFDPVVFERTMIRRDVVLANPSQIAADLLSLPKRSSDEFSELVQWMKRHESDWRS
jgi:hypothetical protein